MGTAGSPFTALNGREKKSGNAVCHFLEEKKLIERQKPAWY